MTPGDGSPDPADVVVRVFEAYVRSEPSTHAEVRRTGPAEVDLDALWRTSGRGEGGGTRALRVLTDAADDNGVTLTVTAMPLHVDPMTGGPSLPPDLDLDALLAWYGRHGFEVDGEEWGCPTMRRTPPVPCPSP